MLLRDGLLRLDGDRLRTAKRWQAAMMRASQRMMLSGDDGEDLRVPVAAALIELYRDDLPEDDLIGAVHIMTAVEAEELASLCAPDETGPEP